MKFFSSNPSAIKISFLLIALPLLVCISSCRKEAGEGGNSSITGKIWVKDYNNNFTVLLGEYPGADVDVYIIYGDNISYGDKIKTSPDGSFEFKYLRKGNYTVYAYSKDRTNPALLHKITMTVNAGISKNKQQLDIGTIEIYE